MGACASAAAVAADKPPGEDDGVELDDPRWDGVGFNDWADACRLQWLRVDFIRKLHAAGQLFPIFQDCPPDCVHVGAPPNGVELYNVIHRYLGYKHPDPKGDHLKDLVDLLEEADGADLVNIDWCATPQRRSEDGTTGNGVMLPEERQLNEAYVSRQGFLVTYSPIRTVVLHRVPPDSERAALPFPEITSSVWITYELLLAAYCQRVINAGHPVVNSMIAPDSLSDPIGMIREGVSSGRLNMKDPSDIDTTIVPNLQRAFGSMKPMYADERGFSSFCIAAEIAWIKVGYVRRYVALLDASPGELRPFPRRQELPRGTFYVGLPPDHRRKYVVSHGWATEHHPSPSSVKLRQLLAAIDADSGASDEDGIFLDFCSLDQRARPQPVGRPPQRERTVEETRRFKLALWEMTRMYAYRGCRVVVLPEIEPWELFEAAGTEPAQVHSEVKGRVCLQSAVWGWVNDVPYHKRGWCFAEFSCAHKAGIIVNEADAAVQAVMHARVWPANVQSYTRDMQDAEIEFTSNGDREYVAYIFNKMCFDPRVATLSSD